MELLEPIFSSASFAFQGRAADICGGSEPAHLEQGLDKVHGGERHVWSCEHFIMAKPWGEAELCQDAQEVPGGPGLPCQGLREAESQILAALLWVHDTLDTGWDTAGQ